MNTTMINIALVILSPALALLANGVFRKSFARFQGRIGPPIIQPFYDLIKLFSKQRVESEESKNPIFYAGLFFAFFFIILAYLIFFGILSFEYDFIIFIYLLVSVEVALICSSFASRNTLSYSASMREILMMLGYELIIAFSLINIIHKSGALSISMVESSLFVAPLSLAFLLFAGMPFLRVTPFDTVSASTEISSGMPTEYSGKLLMIYLLIEKLKDFIYYMLLSKLIIGWNFYTPLIALMLIFSYSLMNASSARYNFSVGAKKIFIAAIFSLINAGVIGL